MMGIGADEVLEQLGHISDTSSDDAVEDDDGVEDAVADALEPGGPKTAAITAATLPVDLSERRRQALHLSSLDLAEVETFLYIRVTSSWRVVDLQSQVVLGVLRNIQGNALQVTCSIRGHGAACRLMLDSRIDFYKCEVALVKWILAGTGVREPSEHNTLGHELRLSFNRDVGRRLRAARVGPGRKRNNLIVIHVENLTVIHAEIFTVLYSARI